MRKYWLLSASVAALLAGCGSINDQGVTAEDILAQQATPTVPGVSATLLRIAGEAERQGNFAQAASTYQQLLDQQPGELNHAVRLGENLRKSGQLARALSVFHSVLTRNPDNIDALEGKGLTLLSLADTEAAGEILTTVHDLAPNRWRTLNAIGVLFASKGLFAESQLYFDEALKLEPSHPAILNNKGLALALGRQYGAALETLFTASNYARRPVQRTQADLNAALVYAIAGDLEQAKAMASRHLEGAGLHNNLGLYALIADNDALAKTHLHMALSESKSFYAKAWNNLNLVEAPGDTSYGQAKRLQIGGGTAPDFGTTGANGLPLPPAVN